MENSQLPSMSSLSPPWVDLPRDITATILQKLGVMEILGVAENVCTTWRSVCRDPSIWQSIDMGDDTTAYGLYDPYIMCRRAVDLSQGQLADITIHFFCDGDLLIYISERCPRLRRLQLVCCKDLEEDSLSTALQNLPLLEELHLYYTSIYPGDDGLMIGISCPLLKSFKLNYSFITDLGLKQISRTMPKLRHLELIGNYEISNKGLQAILDGCPHLETLDVRECDGLDFSGEIEKACSQRIEVLRRPDEALNDNPYFGHRYHRRSYSYSSWSDWSYDMDPFPYNHDHDNYQFQGGNRDDPLDREEDYEDSQFSEMRGALKREAGTRPALRRTQKRTYSSKRRALKRKGSARPALRRPQKHSSSTRRVLKREAQRLALS